MIGTITVANIQHAGVKHGEPITRPGILGNPFILGKDGDRDQIVAAHRKWLWKVVKAGLAGELGSIGDLSGDPNYAWVRPFKEREDVHFHAALWKRILSLKQDVQAGKDLILICNCFPLKCHGDNLKACLEWLIRERAAG